MAEQVGALRRTLNRMLSRHLALKTKRPMTHLLALYSVSRGEVSTQAELADRLLVDAPAVSRIVAKLSRDGLLEQRQGKDRRSVALRVTGKASRELAHFQQSLDWLNGQIRGLLTAAEHGQLRATLSHLQESLGSGQLTRAAAPRRARRR